MILSEEMKNILYNIPSGLCIYRMENKKIYPIFRNNAFYNILGYSDEHKALVEKEMTLLGLHPDDLDEVRRKIALVIETKQKMAHNCRVFSDKLGNYKWIKLESSTVDEGNETLIYVVYSDLSEQKNLEKEMLDANKKLTDVCNAITGGVALYKVSHKFETIYFSNQLPGLTGYTFEEYKELSKGDAINLVYFEDAPRVVEAAMEVIRTHENRELEFRKIHRDGHIVWVKTRVKWIGDEDGCPLLHCVFFDISDLKEAQMELDHLVNSIPGGIASYRVESDKIVGMYISDGVIGLSGYSREEYEEIVKDNALQLIYEHDRPRVYAAAKSILLYGTQGSSFCRFCTKEGKCVWVQMQGRRVGPANENATLSVVVTGMSAEAQLFRNIANDSADAIYVIDKENYDLLYANESKILFGIGDNIVGKKCYEALHGRDKPCEFCAIKQCCDDGAEHQMRIDNLNRHFVSRVRGMDWNGIPAYVKRVRDITDDVNNRRERERLESYFQSIVSNLPGGVAVVGYNDDGEISVEYLSGGFAKMLNMEWEKVSRLHKNDALARIHPDDKDNVSKSFISCINGMQNRIVNIFRMITADDKVIWVKSMLTLIKSEDRKNCVYAYCNDFTKEYDEQKKIKQQFNELIYQHYRTPGFDTLILAHCNITRKRIIEVTDYTGSGLLTKFGRDCDRFFTGISRFFSDEEEQKRFLLLFLSEPALKAYESEQKTVDFSGFIKLPRDRQGRYARIIMNMVLSPSGDLTGILSVTDVTDRSISDRIMHKVFASSYDFIADVDIERDRFSIISKKENVMCSPPTHGKHSEQLKLMLETRIVPKDKEKYEKFFNTDYIKKRLEGEASYSFSFSVVGDDGDIYIKNITVAAVDLRLGRVAVIRTDITSSVQEQQGLFNVIIDTFEFIGFINVNNAIFTVHTREGVLNNLPPQVITSSEEMISFLSICEDGEIKLTLNELLEKLDENSRGFDYVYSCKTEQGERYKKLSILWGDENHQNICLVRADITDIIESERESKRALENALKNAEKANDAKRDFMATMSHDIRTPLNAIIGMNEIAQAHISERERVEDCLSKISASSKHLLSLVNDILDMSKIEQAKVELIPKKLSIVTFKEQLCNMMETQAASAKVNLRSELCDIVHEFFFGDILRINQILINILSNAIKFTNEGGNVDFRIREISPESSEAVRYQFTISDNGIGMEEEFISHIFEPFSRDVSAIHIAGTGLGLSITKGLVELMGGDISVKSKAGEGTSFMVELEFDIARSCDDKAEAAIAMDTASKVKVFEGVSFLVAEDNVINAEIICEILSINGASSIVVREDGALVVEEFANSPKGRYDAILMDIRMPNMNGYEATRAIRRMDRSDALEIPIIAMTANTFSEDIQAALEAGMNAHISKPLDITELKKCLNEEIRKAKNKAE